MEQSECERSPFELITVAESDRLWTGVGVSREGRVFVNYPRWFGPLPVSVAEMTRIGEAKPFPDERWNGWDPSLLPEDHFVCVQSVHVDRANNLWILDPAFDVTQGSVAAGGPKLLKVDLQTDQVVQRITFDESVAPATSYLNDVRLNNGAGYAYITDSNLGAIIVVNLVTGRSRRLLAEHPSTKSEGVVLTIEGEKWLQPDGSAPQVHSDGLAVDNSEEYLYYQALTGHSLYRIRTQWLQDEALAGSELGDKVELVGKTGAADGIEFGPDGCLYLTSLEYNAVRRLTPQGKVEVVVQDPRLKWPDSFAITPDGTVYITTSQVHLGGETSEPYYLFKVQIG